MDNKKLPSLPLSVPSTETLQGTAMSRVASNKKYLRASLLYRGAYLKGTGIVDPLPISSG
jgi:hypothetical protein